MNYIIETGIPIPPKSHNAGNMKYPELATLETGQCLRTTDRSLARCLGAAASHYGKKSHKEFTTRIENNVFRVWRIS